MGETILISVLSLIAIVAATLAFARPRNFVLNKIPERPEVRRRFNNVYAMSTQDRREAIIRFYMNRDSATREQAMLAAIAENGSDRARW